MLDKLKNQKGITLITLAVTIVVLLILATVSIKSMVGENGVVPEAEQAKIEAEYSNVNDEMKVQAVAYNMGQEKHVQKTLESYLKNKGIIDENNIINISKLLGESFSTGNGSGISDVYKLVVGENNESSEVEDGDIVYEIRYYPSNSKSESDYKKIGEIVDIAGEVTIEDILVFNNGVIEGVRDEYLANPNRQESICITTRTIHEDFVDLVIPSQINGIDVTEIGEMAFAGIRNLKSVYVPDTVVEIGIMAFTECIALEKVTGMKNVSSIDSAAFDYCSSLTYLDLGEVYTHLYGVLDGLTSIESITIPASVTYVGYGAFAGWTSSQTINFQCTEDASSSWHTNWKWNCEATINWGVSGE